MSLKPAITQALQKDILGLATGATTVVPLANAVQGLFQNNVVITEKTVYGDLTPATYDGYAPRTIASWRPAFIGSDAEYVIEPSIPAFFTCTGTVTANTVYGTYIADSSGTVLLAAASFDLAITPVAGQAIQSQTQIAVQGLVEPCNC